MLASRKDTINQSFSCNSNHKLIFTTISWVLIIAIISIVIFPFSSFFDLIECYVEWSRQREHVKIDEVLMLTSVVLMFVTALLLKRRWKELELEIGHRKQLEGEQMHLIAQLQESLFKINTLSGLLPICASCKRIRNDNGYWETVEKYITNHSEAEITHGLCPDCVMHLYFELHKKKSEGTSF